MHDTQEHTREADELAHVRARHLDLLAEIDRTEEEAKQSAKHFRELLKDARGREKAVRNRVNALSNHQPLTDDQNGVQLPVFDAEAITSEIETAWRNEQPNRKAEAAADAAVSVEKASRRKENPTGPRDGEELPFYDPPHEFGESTAKPGKSSKKPQPVYS